jgi:YHS domain-containing protein
MLPYHPTRRACLGLLGGLPLAGLARPAWAASPEVFAVDGVAIGGTDPVAYFRQNAPVPGLADFALMWRGATWVFASAETMDAFEMNPDAYAPQFGGYCAYALAKGSLASSVPEAWTIYQDRLYLNYSLAVRDDWQADIPGYLAQAAALWPAILQS